MKGIGKTGLAMVKSLEIQVSGIRVFLVFLIVISFGEVYKGKEKTEELQSGKGITHQRTSRNSSKLYKYNYINATRFIQNQVETPIT